jgi:MFS family permease
LIDSYYETHGIEEGDDPQIDEDIADRASALYSAFYYIGMILSPIVGSLIYEHYRNFNKTCDVFALVSVVFTVLYVLINVLPDWKTLWKKKKHSQNLQEPNNYTNHSHKKHEENSTN